MRKPEDAKAWVALRYTRQKQRWLDGGGDWPLELSLERPSQQVALRNPAAVRAWSESWAKWRATYAVALQPGVALLAESVAWPNIGTQTLPAKLTFSSPADVADFLSDGKSWRGALSRRNLLVERWPRLGPSRLGKHFEILATWDDADFSRLISLLDWFIENPQSNLFLRQLPVAGIDTKWIDLHRRGVVGDLLRRLRSHAYRPEDYELGESDDLASLDFFDICGLRRHAPRIRILVLCPLLRKQIGGLRDIEAPLDEIASLDIHPRRVLVVENKDTGLSLPDIDGAVALIKLGNAVSLGAGIPWIRGLPFLYWGDIDTYGYSILIQARKAFGDVTSVLMDAQTLERYGDRLVPEPSQMQGIDRSALTAGELEVYDGLLSGRWGTLSRLEQERLDWPVAMAAIEAALSMPAHRGPSTDAAR